MGDVLEQLGIVGSVLNLNPGRIGGNGRIGSGGENGVVSIGKFGSLGGTGGRGGESGSIGGTGNTGKSCRIGENSTIAPLAGPGIGDTCRIYIIQIWWH